MIPSTMLDLAARVASAATTASAAVAVPSYVPPFARPLAPQLVGMSLEFQFWPVFAGNATGQPNTYVNQLLANLGERTGHATPVRVGGGSENTAVIDSSLELWDDTQLSEVYGPFTNRATTLIGRDWYNVAGNLPAGTPFAFGCNEYNITEVDKQTKMMNAAFSSSALSHVSLEFIQIGNEPNFYFANASAYLEKWVPLARTALGNIKMNGQSSSHPSLWIGSEVLSSGQAAWRLRDSLSAGILDDKDINAANAVLEEHFYSGSGTIGAIPGGPSPGTLMNKATIRSNLSSIYSGRVAAESYGKKYFVGETNTYASEGIFGLSNTGESAVWAVDYLLQLATIGVRQAYFHNTPNRMFSVFQPGWGFTNGTGIEEPHIMPIYNGMLVVNEMIGNGSKGVVHVAELDTVTTTLAAYGVWEEDGQLARMVLINSAVATETTARTALQVTLAGVNNTDGATIKRLSIPYTVSTSGITWGGLSFETKSGVPSGKAVETAMDGNSVTVAASEVVMISFKTQNH
ncbi:hypothetical protein SEUCBS139899_002176 [Sporothrix eucalyptigena]|uniref:Beta-glucuronidase C-terminal domain-containing protein n=1 Tax=Sporothrix eucalyptigena TaxID=1812306 RepID=A0ABP0B4U7_9PEZI